MENKQGEMKWNHNQPQQQPVSTWSGSIKEPSGKKLPSGFIQERLSKPHVQCFAVFERRSCKPAVMFSAIANLLNKVLSYMTMEMRINYLFYEVFFKSVIGQNR